MFSDSIVGLVVSNLPLSKGSRGGGKEFIRIKYNDTDI